MIPEKRRQEIENYIFKNKTVTLNEISEKYNISINTIRRDLAILVKKGLIKKVYGGASVNEIFYKENSLSVRIMEHSDEKKRIAQEAAKRINNGDTIFIESGSTALALVNSIEGRKRLNVLTISPHILIALCDFKRANKFEGKIYCSGGMWLEDPDDLLVGPQSIDFWESFRVDTAFIGFIALNLEDGLMVPNSEEAEIVNKIISISNKIIGIGDSSKFNRRSIFKVCPLSVFDEIITDSNLDKQIAFKYSSVTKITLV